jgi:hypothetical protein
MFRIFSPVPTGAHIYIGSLNFLWITASAIILLFFVILLFRVLKNKTVLPLWIVLLITAVIVVFPSFLAVAKLHDQIVIPVRYFFAGLPFIIIGLVPVLNRLWQFTLYKILMVIGVLLFSMLFFIRAGEWESSLSFSKAEAEYHPDAFYEKDNYIKMLLNTGHYNDAINQINVLQKIPAYKDDKVKAQASYYRAKILREHFRNINSAVMEIKQARGLDSSNLQYLYEHALIVLKSKGKSHALKILYDALDSEHFSIAQKDDIKININEIKKLR